MLPLYDAELNAQTYNIFQPLSSILPYDLPKLSVQSIDPPPSTAQPTSPFKKSPEIDTYCKACKKKFNNAITYTNHLKSAKHIANEKKLTNTSAKSSSSTRITVNPQVQDALEKLEQASLADPTQAVTIYWNQAQMLFALKRPQYTEKALGLLINTLSSNSNTTFSSAQITSFLYNSRLALARLYWIYQQVDDSRSVYLDALESKWKLDKKELVDIAKNLRHLSITTLLTSCDQLATKYLTRERNRTKPAPTLIDTNNSITTILNEAGNLFAQQQVYQAFQLPSEHIAIVLYATCSLVCPFEQVPGFKKADFYYLIKQVYVSLELEHRIIELDMLDPNDTWNIFNALLLALEIDDLVRAQTIQLLLVDQQVYPDVKLLCDIYKSRVTLAHMKHNVDFIQLLLDQTNEPLLISSQSKQEQAIIMDRLRDLTL